MPKPNWKRILIAVSIILPIVLIADLGIFQLKHQALIWVNGGRWCADVDEASGEVVEILYGDAACEGEDILKQV